jgi:hypothetical protein
VRSNRSASAVSAGPQHMRYAGASAGVLDDDDRDHDDGFDDDFDDDAFDAADLDADVEADVRSDRNASVGGSGKVVLPPPTLRQQAASAAAVVAGATRPDLAAVRQAAEVRRARHFAAPGT